MRQGRWFAVIALAGSLLGPTAALAAVDDVVLVSRANGHLGAAANASSSESSSSADGCRVAFSSLASNLATITPGTSNVFVRDHCAGTTTLVSQSTAAVPGNGNSQHPSISPDGRFVAFDSAASNLGEPGPDTNVDVFRRDLNTGTTICISVDNSPAPPINSVGGSNPAISSGGGVVAFQSTADANDLDSAAGDANGSAPDVFIRRPSINTTNLMSRIPASVTTGNAGSQGPSISDDGARTAFQSVATDLVAGDSNGASDIYTNSNPAAGVGMNSNTFTGTPGNGNSTGAQITGDGLSVIFNSTATNLQASDLDAAQDTFAKSSVNGSVELVSRQSGELGDKAVGGTAEGMPSGGGRFVTLSSGDPDLAEGGAAPTDVFIRDRTNQTMFLASRAAGALGAGANAPSSQPDFASGGGFVTFTSGATNLSAEDGDGTNDIFRREIAEPDIPVQGANVNLRPLAGSTMIKAKGSKKFSPLSASSKFGVGSVVDVRRGRVELNDIHSGIREAAKFYKGKFRVKQNAKGDPYLTAFLSKPKCGKKGKGNKKGRLALTSMGPLATSAAKQTNSLFAKGKGKFRTTGFRGSATVRGTEWLTVNRCDGSTLFQVFQGGITIKEKGKKKPQIMTVGKTKTKYVAKVRKGSKK